MIDITFAGGKCMERPIDWIYLNFNDLTNSIDRQDVYSQLVLGVNESITDSMRLMGDMRYNFIRGNILTS
jgi:hypothetical protein